MNLYSVSEVADLTGVTIKTLHYYQKVGLLKPAHVGENRYRYYSDRQIETLHEIMFYRTLDFSLNDIAVLLSKSKDQSRFEVLQSQLDYVVRKRSELTQIIKTLEKTIESERSGDGMEEKEKFEGFKREDSIYRSMQNITLIFSKPVALVFFILSIAIIAVHGRNLMKGTSLYGNSLGGMVAGGAIVVCGVIGFVLSFRSLFLVKTRDLLNLINDKYDADEKNENGE